MCLQLKKRFQSITDKLLSASAIIILVILWQGICSLGLVDSFMLPSPVDVASALISEFPTLMKHSGTTLIEAFAGLGAGIAAGFIIAVIMDRSEGLYKAFYPVIILTQTVPAVSIAPLLVLWFGYEMMPKIVLIAITTFFPITVGLLEGFRSSDKDSVNLLKAMGADKNQIFRHIKLPGALPQFFSGLRISVSYAVVGAVIAEWLGGFDGLGVYMTRVKKAYAFDKMFAVIILISVISLVLMKLVDYLHKKTVRWEGSNDK